MFKARKLRAGRKCWQMEILAAVNDGGNARIAFGRDALFGWCCGIPSARHEGAQDQDI